MCLGTISVFQVPIQKREEVEEETDGKDGVFADWKVYCVFCLPSRVAPNPLKPTSLDDMNMKTFTKIFVNLANWEETKSVFVQIVIEWDWIADLVLINAILTGAEDIVCLFLT